jgi:conjugal transfer/entry exclusion protein
MDAQNLRRLDDAALGQFHQLQQRLDRATDQLGEDEKTIAQLQGRLREVADEAVRQTAELHGQMQTMRQQLDAHRRGHAEQMGARIAADKECEKAIDVLRRIAQAAGLLETQLAEDAKNRVGPMPVAVVALRAVVRRLVEQVQREYPAPPELLPEASTEKGGVR